MQPSHFRADPLTLRRKTRVPAWAQIGFRMGLALALIGLAVAVHWLDRGGLRDSRDGQVSFADVLYFTMTTVTTVGYGDIVPVTPRARMFDTFLLTPVRLFLWLIFLGTAYEFLFRRAWQRWRMNVIQRNLKHHVVLCGFGASGAETLRELVRRGTPAEQVVIVDEREAVLLGAEDAGATVLTGDATHNATLEAARVGSARAVMIAAGRDDTNILIVLTVKRLAPRARISTVIREVENEDIARQAGADTVINPTSFAGLLLAGSTDGHHVAAYMADLAAADGRVTLREREVTADEVGGPLRGLATGLGLRVYRGEHCFGFWEPESQRLEAGDTVVEVLPCDERVVPPEQRA